MEIPLTEVESSQIHAIGHDAETNTLAVQFKGRGGPGSIYHYANFPAEKFQEFLGAESLGRYFGNNIKPMSEKHPYTKVWPKPEHEA